MPNYYRILLGRGNMHAKEARENGFIGVDFGLRQDFEGHLPDNWRDFNRKFIPKWIEQNPGKSKISAGLACGMLWTVAKGMEVGDVVLCPDGKGGYYVGNIMGNYEFHDGKILPHRRSVAWSVRVLLREEMSDALRNSVRSIGTVSNVTRHASEIEKLLSGGHLQGAVEMNEGVEDPSVFALEKHLEDFLVQNWKSTELGKRYDIYEEDDAYGQQYPSDTGPIDILAISKDKKELLVVELKRGRVSDVVVGQIQRYMGYVKDELAEPNQTVRGVIIGFEDDLRIHRALSVAQNIEFFTYKIQFELQKQTK